MKSSEFRRNAADPMHFFGQVNVATPDGPVQFSAVMQPFQRERYTALAPSLQAVAAGKRPPVGRY
ncbi:MAG TPA: hypothetical protein VMV10_02200 [Pirellulales bacterium]|nr:hypothetical protein [Pirellulales bacterium]